uniref:Uncharacterized protein n=1 Tax=Arundo donax TaxID=35708 RepID=A0A0A8ZU19_ARUDO
MYSLIVKEFAIQLHSAVLSPPVARLPTRIQTLFLTQKRSLASSPKNTWVKT